MGWITLALRKQTLKTEINQANFDILSISRTVRSSQRHLSYEESVFNSKRTKQLREAKEAYLEVRDNRPDVGSSDYEEWKLEYSKAQEDYQADKQDIEDYYDGIKSELEQEAKDDESINEEQKTQLETQRDAMNAEYQAIAEQVKQEIESSAVKF